MKSKEDQKNNLIGKIAEYNREDLSNRSLIAKRLARKERVLTRLIEQNRDRELGERFKEIVIEERKKNDAQDKQTFFDFELIDRLNVDYDILMIYGGKSIGKTYSMSKMVRKIKREEPEAEFMFLRNTKEELVGGFKTQLLSKEGPFSLVSSKYLREKDYVYPFHLSDIDKEPYTTPAQEEPGRINPDIPEGQVEQKKRGRPKKKNVRWGYATYINGKGLESFQGGSYENLRLLVWDECNDVGTWGIITDESLNRFLTFVLSLERKDRDKMKIIMTGNLLRQHTGVADNLILTKFGISYDARLKYGVREDEQGRTLKMLYINTGVSGDLFDGVTDQKFSHMFGEEAILDLTTNNPAPRSSKVYNPCLFAEAIPKFSFVFYYKDQLLILYVGTITIEGTKKTIDYPILEMEKFDKDGFHLGYEPISDTIEITNQYGIVRNASDLTIAKMVRRLQQGMKARRLGFSRDSVCRLFNEEVFGFLKRKYKKILDEFY